MVSDAKARADKTIVWRDGFFMANSLCAMALVVVVATIWVDTCAESQQLGYSLSGKE